jgi:hypothetical protein
MVGKPQTGISPIVYQVHNIKVGDCRRYAGTGIAPDGQFPGQDGAALLGPGNQAQGGPLRVKTTGGILQGFPLFGA